jgi:hypothetical protein
MLSRDDAPDTSSSPIERPSRPGSRREVLYEKRHKNTDTLPKINSDMPGGRAAPRQVAQLREENKRLRWELDEMQRLLLQQKNAQVQLVREIATIHSGHQQEIEQYEIHLREMIDECNQLQEANRELERRYQELYHSFQDTVEEEAGKLVEEAARTLVLSPDHTPALLRDVAKTLEFQVKQTEDQHVAELLSLMRQAQHKADLLEQELAFEREKIAAERQNIIRLQSSISEQAQLRYTTIRKHLRAQWTMGVTFITTAALMLFTILVLTFVALKMNVDVAVFLSLVICIGLAYFLARVRTNHNLQKARKQQKPATTATPVKSTANPVTPSMKKV